MKAKLAYDKYNELVKDIEGSEPVDMEDWNNFFSSSESVSMNEILAMNNINKIIMKVMIEIIEELLTKNQNNELH